MKMVVLPVERQAEPVQWMGHPVSCVAATRCDRKLPVGSRNRSTRRRARAAPYPPPFRISVARVTAPSSPKRSAIRAATSSTRRAGGVFVRKESGRRAALHDAADADAREPHAAAFEGDAREQFERSAVDGVGVLNWLGKGDPPGCEEGEVAGHGSSR